MQALFNNTQRARYFFPFLFLVLSKISNELAMGHWWLTLPSVVTSNKATLIPAYGSVVSLLVIAQFIPW